MVFLKSGVGKPLHHPSDYSNKRDLRQIYVLASEFRGSNWEVSSLSLFGIMFFVITMADM